MYNNTGGLIEGEIMDEGIERPLERPEISEVLITRPRKEPKSNENEMIPCHIIHASSSAGHHHNALSNDSTLKLLYAFLLAP